MKLLCFHLCAALNVTAFLFWLPTEQMPLVRNRAIIEIWFLDKRSKAGHFVLQPKADSKNEELRRRNGLQRGLNCD